MASARPRPQGSGVFRECPHLSQRHGKVVYVVSAWNRFTVTGDVPARALVVTGPPELDRQIAARQT
jgi:hypothetical protein